MVSGKTSPFSCTLLFVREQSVELLLSSPTSPALRDAKSVGNFLDCIPYSLGFFWFFAHNYTNYVNVQVLFAFIVTTPTCSPTKTEQPFAEMLGVTEMSF